MAINTDISDLAWLTQPADPSASLARGAAVGSQIAQNYLHGVGLAQQAMANEVQQRQNEQRLAMEMQQLPLAMTLQEQQKQMNAIKIEDVLRQRQNLISTETAFAGLADTVHHAMTDASPVDVNPFFFEAVAKHPRLAETERFQTLWKDYNTSLNAKLALQEAKNAAKAQEFKPRFGVEENPLTGEKEAYWFQSPNNAPLVKPDKEATPSTAQKNFKELDALQKGLDAATASGDPAAIAEAKRKLDTFSALATPPSESITYDPVNGLNITKGKPASDLTVASQSNLQSSLQAATTSIDVANRLEPLISSETVGIRAFAGSVLKDRVLAQFFPGIASQDRANAEVLSAQLRASTIKQLKSDGNISEKERQQILQAVPAINQPADSADHARELIQASRKVAAIQAIVSASKLKTAIPSSAVLALPWTELRDLAKTGVLTPEQATAAYEAQLRARGGQ